MSSRELKKRPQISQEKTTNINIKRFCVVLLCTFFEQILGILTGPMGSLGVTLDKLSNTSDNKDELHGLEKKLKNDLYSIAAAAERKQGDDVIANHKKATKHIVAYASAL